MIQLCRKAPLHEYRICFQTGELFRLDSMPFRSSTLTPFKPADVLHHTQTPFKPVKSRRRTQTPLKPVDVLLHTNTIQTGVRPIAVNECQEINLSNYTTRTQTE
jgi:hypothetical protein